MFLEVSLPAGWRGRGRGARRACAVAAKEPLGCGRGQGIRKAGVVLRNTFEIYLENTLQAV